MNIIKKIMLISVFIPLISYSSLYSFERGGGGNRNFDHGGYNRGGYDRAGNNNFHHEGSAYEAGWNHGNSNSSGNVYMQPNGNTLNELDQYSNPNSAINQNKRYNQSQQQ